MKSCRKLNTKQDEQRIRSKDKLKTMKKGCRKKRTLKKNYSNINISDNNQKSACNDSLPK